MTKNLISVVLPVYNQADHIEAIITEYQTALAKIPNPYEIILVVNGCRDNSLSICLALAQKYETIKVVHSEKGGWGLAIKRGLQDARGDLLCYTNSARTSARTLPRSPGALCFTLNVFCKLLRLTTGISVFIRISIANMINEVG